MEAIVVFSRKRLVAAVGCFIVAAPTWAQAPASNTQCDYLAQAEIAAGLTLQAPANVGRTDFGLVLLSAVYASKWLAIIGDADVYFDNARPVRGMLGGIRGRTPGLITEGKGTGRFFAQVLVGEQQNPRVPHRFAIQPGAGGEAYLGKRLLVHFEYDYRWMPGAGRNLSTGRLLWALGVQIGTHS
jgi:hypothetical protein